MIKLWLKDCDVLDRGILPHLIAKIARENNWSDDLHGRIHAKASSGDFRVEPDPQKGGVNVIFDD